MMTQTGQVNSFKELGEHFLEFVQQSNDTTDPWEVIDDRLDEFYGATIKFPVNVESFGLMSSDIKSMNNLTDVRNAACIELPWDLLVYSFRFIEDMPVSYSQSTVYGDSFFTSLLNIIYKTTNTVQISTFYDHLFCDYSLIPGYTINYNETSCYDYTTHKANLLECKNAYGRLDPLNTLFLQDASYDFSPLVGKDHVFIMLPVNSCFYFYDIESIAYKNIVAYVKAIKNKFLTEMSNVNTSSSYSPEVDVIVYYVPNMRVDFADDSSGTPILNPDSAKAIRNYVTYMQNNLSNVSFINTLDFSSAGFTYGTVRHKIYVDDMGSNSPTMIRLGVISSPKDHIVKENICPDIWHVTSNLYPYYQVRDFWSTTKPNLNYIYNASTYGKNMQNVNMDSSRTYTYTAYISLQYNKITPTTYNEWLTNTKDHYMSETFNSNRLRPVWYSSSLVYERTTISNQRQNDIANIFKNTGEVLFISPHIKYDKNLWMAEQGGIACDHETRNQSIEDNCLRAQHIRYPVSGGTPQLYWNKLPPFPSLGCPMFTIREDQLTASRELGEDAIKYYFVRTNTSASIVIYSRMTDSSSDKFGVQHMSFGALDCFSISEQFMYPLYVAGGNGALDKEHWVSYLPTGGPPQHEVGNIYDLYMGNVSMSNSNLILSAKFNGSNTTNFRVLCPDGHWDNIFNVVQTCTLIVDPDECFPTPWTPRYYIYNEPVVGGSELGDNRFGGTTLEHGNNSIKKIDTHLIKRGYISPPSTRMVTEDIIANSPITPIVPVFSSHKTVSPELWNRHRYGPIGKIPLCYSTWSRYLRFGELEVNGKKFLAIPCTYEDKLWWLEARTKLDLATLDKQWEKILTINNKLYNYIIYDYLLLQLEE